MAFVTGKDLLEKVADIRPNVPSLQAVFSFDELDGADYWKTILHVAQPADYEQLEKVKKNLVLNGI